MSGSCIGGFSLTSSRSPADIPHVNIDKLQQRCAGLLADGERLVAATKAMPRGSAHEIILGAAGSVTGGTISPLLAGAGAMVGARAGSQEGDRGRSERSAAGVDVAAATNILLAVTDRRVVLLKLSSFGKPKAVEAALARRAIAGVVMGETKLFGQRMAEIVLTTTEGHEVGFGVAKVHRRDGEAVVAALAG